MLIREESVLKIVTDYISVEKKADGEVVAQERRKGEEVWLEMWERERGDNVVKKEIKEEEGKRGKSWMDELDKNIDNTLNINQEISQVS